MTEEERKTFEDIAEMCREGCYNSINVASKIRSRAIVAAWQELSRASAVVPGGGYQPTHGALDALNPPPWVEDGLSAMRAKLGG